MTRTLPVLILLSVVVTAAWARDANACASCACGDVTITTFGTEKPFAGRLRLSLASAWRVESEGVFATDRERIDEVLTSASIAYSPTSWLVVGAVLPVAAKSVSSPGDANLMTLGTADAALRARAIVLTDGLVVPHHLFALTASGYLPTTLPARDAHGAVLPDDAQPGYGAWAADAGAFYAYMRAPFALFTSARGLAALPGPLRTAPGPALFVDVTGQWQPIEALAIRLGVDGRAALPGQSPDGPFGDGLITFAAAGGAFRATDDVVIGLTTRVPVWQDLPVGHHEGSAIEASVTVDL